jgi:hypothetical protein
MTDNSNHTKQEEKSDESAPIPKEFRQIMRDFLRDLFTTFPEYKSTVLVTVAEDENAPLDELFCYVKKVFPERFFDILYKNDDIFKEDSGKNTEFLPGIDFSVIWRMDDVSDSIRDTIWKYLQLIMFSVLETIQTQESFGDTAKLFEAINEEELKSKIQETVEQMKGLFSDLENKTESGAFGGAFGGASGGAEGEGINLEDLPNADSVHEHLNGLLDGKLGKLAAEIAEETAQDFEMDLNQDGDVGDMFKKLFRNPGKLMGLVNNISSKLDAKMKSGDIKESDLMKEAGDLMSKMKNMPGMPNIEELMKTMNVPKNKQGMMRHQFNQNMRANGTKARLQRKLEERQKAKGVTTPVVTQSVEGITCSDNSSIVYDGKSFSDGSMVQRSKNKKKKKKKKN